MSKIVRVLLMCGVLAMVSSPVLAEDGVPPGTEEKVPVADAPAEEEAAAPTVSTGRAIAILGASLAAALAAVGGGFCIARIGMACIEATARQPEAGGQMFAPMIITAAMVEGATLFAVVVCMLALVM